MSEEWCQDLADAISSAYAVGAPLTCRFLRSGFNEHFRATAGETEFHVRVYYDGKYYISGPDDFRCELALTAALAEAGCAVAAPIPRRSGELLSVAEVGGQSRCFALLLVAPGDIKSEPSIEDAEAIGRAVAMIHANAGAVAPSLPGTRYHLDRRYLLDQPLRELRRAAGDAPELASLEALVGELADVLNSLPKGRSDYGLIHADFHLGNMHFAEDGRLTIFDFDHCAYGWRAYDFAPLRMSLSDVNWDAVLDAYAQERPLPPGIDQIDQFVKIRALWDIGDILAMEAVWGTDDASRQVPEALPKFCERLGAS
jgi:Ser/Thr protein kinase RdoA (MazF antagonist)